MLGTQKLITKHLKEREQMASEQMYQVHAAIIIPEIKFSCSFWIGPNDPFSLICDVLSEAMKKLTFLKLTFFSTKKCEK